MKPDTILILYVEDDPLTLRSVTDRLRRHGVGVLAADSGEQALNLVQDHPALSAVLVDLNLPGIDGLETYARLVISYPGLPLVVCSAHTEEGVQNRLRSMGVPEHCHLRKPCPFRSLLAAIEDAIRHSQAGKSADGDRPSQ